MTDDGDKRRMPTEWNLPDHLPHLEDHEVQVWRIPYDQSYELTARLEPILQVKEQAQAMRLRSAQVRDHFTIGRASLRILLGNLQKIDSRDVVITTGIHGKPDTPSIGEHKIFFNVSHSKETILIALCRQGSVGIDVEHIDRDTNIMEVAEANFTKRESNRLAAISDPETRRRTFFHYWTRKEAIGKADGRGLLLPLGSFDVSFESMSSQPVRVNHFSDQDSKDEKFYFVKDISLGDKAVAALALEARDCRINTLIFPQEMFPAAGAGQ
jgi:4'-phosphopantetheinyl transferase